MEVSEVIDPTLDICGIYQECCLSSKRGSQRKVEWFYCACIPMKKADADSKFTKDSICFLVVQHDQLVFVCLCLSNTSLFFFPSQNPCRTLECVHKSSIAYFH